MAASVSERIYNFSAGPAVLPLAVLEQAQRELVCLPGVGASVMEISHRSAPFLDILESAKRRIASLLGIGDDYEILFLQGGSRLQFSMIPMNLLTGSVPAEYLITGSWSSKSLEEAVKEGQVHVAWDGDATGYDRVPAGEIRCRPDAPYVYYTSNETIGGVQFRHEPRTGPAPLVCDASSDFLSRPVALERYGLLYACAQKNAGPAGVTVVIIRSDLLDRGRDDLPGYLNYRSHAKDNSLWNTPPTFGIYLVGLVAAWIEDEIGGLEAMAALNAAKAQMLYEVIDASAGFYRGHARPDSRSHMNVTFRLGSETLEKQFLAEASSLGLDGLQGHRSVGGIRASVYNAMPRAGVERLRDFMREFEDENR